jgi:periplasmic protein TonB
MNRGFHIALAISAAAHACLFWAVSADSPPIPLMTSGEICVECIASPAAEPHPLLNGVEEKPIKETAPQIQAAQTPPEPEAPAEALPKPKPDPIVAEEPPEEQKIPEPPVSPAEVREIRRAEAPKDSAPVPSLSKREREEEPLPVKLVQPPLAPPKPLDKPQTKERPASPPPEVVQEKKLDKDEAPTSPKSGEKQQPEEKKSSEPISQPEPSPKVQENPRRPDTEPQPSREVKAPPVASSSPQQASLPSSPRTQGVITEARLLGHQKPVYPREAQLRGQEGEVVIALEISAEGRVVNAKLHKTSSHQILDDSALLFAESLEFVPASQGGTPAPTNVLLPVRYRLVDP